MLTHYDVLGVPSDAPLEEIKRAYYDRARIYHPDGHASSPPAVRAEAERAMQSLNAAWTALREPGRRRRYDRVLVRAAAAAGAPAPPTATKAASARPARPRATPDRRTRAELGSGFQYWFGGGGLSSLRSPGGRRGLNLRLTGSSLAPLEALVPDGLIGLHAEGRPLVDGELRHLSAMRSLRSLDLSGTRITDAGLVHLLGCVDLEVLSLWDTAVTDDGLALLGRLPNLRHLGLGNTAVTDAGLRHLAGLRRLRLVQLAGTAVVGPGLRHLHGLPELASVTLPWKVRARDRRLLRSALPRTAALV